MNVTKDKPIVKWRRYHSLASVIPILTDGVDPQAVKCLLVQYDDKGIRKLDVTDKK